MRELLVATRSAGKLRELTPMLIALGFRVLNLDDAGVATHPAEDALEVFETFEENALAKARWFLASSQGRPVIADDSGLAVDALAGRPGVRSKRWSGRDDLDGEDLDALNNARLVRTLRETGVPEPWAARYVCAAACAWPGGDLVVTGESHGAIIGSARGSGGFGYDPHFVSSALGRTFGEANREDKAVVSHRGHAVRALVAALSTNAAWNTAYS